MKKKSDSAIQQDVLRELKWDTRVEETEVGIHAYSDQLEHSVRADVSSCSGAT
jgi:hypothetical protein